MVAAPLFAWECQHPRPLARVPGLELRDGRWLMIQDQNTPVRA